MSSGLNIGSKGNVHEKWIKRVTIQDSTSQKIFDLEELVFLLVLASVPWW